MSLTKRRRVDGAGGTAELFDAFEDRSIIADEEPAATTELVRPKNEVNVFFEAEILEVNSYHQFSTLGAYVDLESGERKSGTDVRFFSSVAPDTLLGRWSELSPVSRTVITQRLRLEVQRGQVKFLHQGRGVVGTVTERQALMDLVTWLRGLLRPVRFFVHCKSGRLVSVLLGKLQRYGLYSDFGRMVSGLCDVTSLAWSRGFRSLWGGRDVRQPPDFGSLRAAMTPAVGSTSVEAEESDELAELMCQFVNQIRETGGYFEKKKFLTQVSFG